MGNMRVLVFVFFAGSNMSEENKGIQSAVFGKRIGDVPLPLYIQSNLR